MANWDELEGKKGTHFLHSAENEIISFIFLFFISKTIFSSKTIIKGNVFICELSESRLEARVKVVHLKRIFLSR